jgi:hypothetical protein
MFGTPSALFVFQAVPTPVIEVEPRVAVIVPVV